MNEEKFLCSVCGSSLTSLKSFKKHLEIKHPDNLDELLDIPKKARRSRAYMCHLCSRKFRFKKILRCHIESEHCEVGEAPVTEVDDPDVLSEDHNYMDQALKYEKDDFVEDTDFVCRDCGSIFSTLFNLRKHVKAKHPDDLEILAPKKKIGVFQCDECGNKFSHRKSLARHKISKHKSLAELKECSECGKTFINLINFHKHVKTKHPDSTSSLVLQGIKVGEFSCDECGKVFSQRKNLRRHVTGKHKEASAYYTGKPVAIYQCPLCSFIRSGDVSQILNHFKSDHDTEVVSKEVVFNAKEDFLEWKDNLEHLTKSSYIKKAHVGSTSYFRCHRSGKYVPRGKGIRNIKTQGTSKIGGFCPAGMQVRLTDGKYYVKYTDTHIGHTNDVKHLKLTSRERLNLVKQITSNVPFEEVLSKTRKSEGNLQDVARVNLVTKQDLTNIVRQYQLEGTVVKSSCRSKTKIRSASQVESLDEWLDRNKENILYYKPQSCPDPEQMDLQPEDFVLIMMTELQRDIIIRYGGGCICLDRTDVSSTRLHLSTITVVDGMRSGSPTAILVSNRLDTDVLEFFFRTIKQIVGDITPGLLLTDVADYYYTAWVRVMGEPGITLFCLWHVERDWSESLNSVSTVNYNKIFEILQNLRSLMHESNQKVFHYKLREMCSSLSSDTETDNFALYFVNNYSENYHYWSRAYRPEDALQVDNELERLHLSIKYLYTETKKNQRFDKTADFILQFFDNRLIEGSQTERNSSKKVKNIITGHKASMLLTVRNIFNINNSWYIQQLVKKHGEYRVDEVNPTCQCEDKCLKCNVCVHRFTCTCPDNVLKFNMCSHIHLVCRFIGTGGEETDEEQMEEEDNPTEYIGEIVIVDPDELNPEYNIKQEVVEETELAPNQNLILKEKKIKIASLSNEILESINSVDEGEAFIQILKAAKPTVASIRDDSDKTVYISSDVNSDYQNIIPVKRVLYTALPFEGTNSPEFGGVSTNAIEAHITLDSDGITLLSQAANLASSTTE